MSNAMATETSALPMLVCRGPPAPLLPPLFGCTLHPHCIMSLRAEELLDLNSCGPYRVLAG